MLVLSRKKNESIMIGDNIEIIVVAIAGNKVRLGIEAPRDVIILRREVYEAIQHNEGNIGAPNNGASSSTTAHSAASDTASDAASDAASDTATQQCVPAAADKP